MTEHSGEPGSVKLFYSYSSRDEHFKEDLEKHLNILLRKKIINDLRTRRIGGGEKWDHQIDPQFNEADIILLLVSPDFLASDYCWEEEVERAVERHESREAVVIPAAWPEAVSTRTSIRFGSRPVS